MNWDQAEGKWKQLRGSVKQKWAKLTDNDLDYIAGSRERFIGKLQERYGIAREDAQMQSEQWLNALAESGMGAGARPGGPERSETHRSGSST
ncbi:MAG TPA: CsbD family protein [Candidatus Solibacter sp.]|nr:CsbD family protein [Candidatus Solibacter sp.]